MTQSDLLGRNGIRALIGYLVVWGRSGSLALIVILHGAIDALPNTAAFSRTWG
jgi:hypothetical protein